MRSLAVSLCAVLGLTILLGASPAQAAVPDAPVITSVTPASGSADIVFSTVTGAASYSYTINGGSPVTAGNPLGFTVSSLTNGQIYCFRLYATNSDGTSTASNARCAIPNNPSTAATAVPVITNVTASANSLSVAYTRTNDGFAVDGYNVWLNGTHYTWIYDFTSPMTIPGLSADSAYSIQIKASGPAGAPDSTFSAAYSARTEPAPAPPAPAITPPGAPGVWVTKAGNGSIAFTLIPPESTGGQSPTRYRYIINGDVTETDPNSLSHTLTGLTNGVTYTISASAANSAGWGSSGSATARPVGPATTPRNVRGVGSVRAATISWEPPANDGGSPVTGFLVYRADGSVACSAQAAERSCSIDGLRSVSTYAYTVAASTALGIGDQSPRIEISTPRAESLPPTDFTVAPAARRTVRLAWKYPKDDGGQSLSYVVRYERTDRRAGARDCYTTTTSCTISGIMQNQEYRYTLMQFTRGGGGSQDLSTEFTLSGDMPTKVRNPKAVQVNDAFVLTWSPPSNADSAVISKYRVRMFADNVGDSIGHLYDEIVCEVSAKTRTCTTRPLSSGLYYRFDVFALDSEGDPNDPAATELQPIKLAPVPPTTLADAENGGAKITVVDTANSMWREADSFEVTRVDDFFGLVTSPACTIVRPATSCTVTGLSNEAGYRFVAVAKNPAGTSRMGLPSQVVEPSPNSPVVTAPGAPRNLRATTKVALPVSAAKCACPGVKVGMSLDQVPPFRTDDFIEIWTDMYVSWDRPADTGGARDIVYTATVTRYFSESSRYGYVTQPQFNSCTTRELSCVIRVPYYPDILVSPGVVYTTTVFATNSAGWKLSDPMRVTPKGTLASLS